jgi:hypothetical protein
MSVTIAKSYRLPATGDALMIEITEMVGYPEFTDANPVYNTTNLAQYAELGTRVCQSFQDSSSRPFVAMFMRREAPHA